MKMNKTFLSLTVYAVMAFSPVALQATPSTFGDLSAAPDAFLNFSLLGTTFGGAAQTANCNWASLAGLPADGPCTLSLTGVNLTGSAVLNFGAYSQQTTGGSLYITQGANTLTANLGSGVLQVGGSSGSQFTISNFTFGGSLGSLFLPGTGSESLSLVNVSNVGLNGQNIAPFTADGNLLLAGTPVPEPAQWGVIGATLLGLGALRRRRIAS